VSSPVGPYTPAVRAGPWLVCSGQLGVEPGPDGPVLVPGGFEAQARKALANLSALLWGREIGWGHVVKTTVFLTDMAAYAEMNEAYTDSFAGHRPARSAVAVAALPLGASVEIEAWAWLGS
jgi:2-iminobutanoate/2-iminopropanoate deaminase